MGRVPNEQHEAQFLEANAAYFLSRELSGLESGKHEGRYLLRPAFIWLYQIYTFGVVHPKYSSVSRVARLGKRKDDLFLSFRPKAIFKGPVKYPDDSIMLEGSEESNTQYQVLYHVTTDSSTSRLRARHVKTLSPQGRISSDVFRFRIAGHDICDAYLLVESPWSLARTCLFMVSKPNTSKTLLVGGDVDDDPDMHTDKRCAMRYSRIPLPNHVVAAIKRHPKDIRIVLVIKLSNNAILLNHLLSTVSKQAAPITHLRLHLAFNAEHTDFPAFRHDLPLKMPLRKAVLNHCCDHLGVVRREPSTSSERLEGTALHCSSKLAETPDHEQDDGHASPVSDTTTTPVSTPTYELAYLTPLSQAEALQSHEGLTVTEQTVTPPPNVYDSPPSTPLGEGFATNTSTTGQAYPSDDAPQILHTYCYASPARNLESNLQDTALPGDQEAPPSITAADPAYLPPGLSQGALPVQCTAEAHCSVRTNTVELRTSEAQKVRDTSPPSLQSCSCYDGPTLLDHFVDNSLLVPSQEVNHGIPSRSADTGHPISEHPPVDHSMVDQSVSENSPTHSESSTAWACEPNGQLTSYQDANLFHGGHPDGEAPPSYHPLGGSGESWTWGGVDACTDVYSTTSSYNFTASSTSYSANTLDNHDDSRVSQWYPVVDLGYGWSGLAHHATGLPQDGALLEPHEQGRHELTYGEQVFSEESPLTNYQYAHQVEYTAQSIALSSPSSCNASCDNETEPQARSEFNCAEQVDDGLGEGCNRYPGTEAVAYWWSQYQSMGFTR